MPAPKRASTDTAVHREPFHDVSEALFMENFSAHGKKPEDSLLASCYDIRTGAVQQCIDLVNSVRRIYANPTLNSVQQDIEVGKLQLKRDTECEACGRITRRERNRWIAKLVQLGVILLVGAFMYAKL